VLRSDAQAETRLMNGTTLHGVQSNDPVLRHVPGSYYSRGGPIGDVFAALDAPGASPRSDDTRSLGFVGLGAGALATYARPGDQMTFYEIDPIVVAVASDPRYFTYLSDAPSAPTILLGDARLTLASQPAGQHDVLVLDAFSSDTVPVHLLTVEAFREYARVIRPGGLIAAHVSNRYYDLVPAVAAAAERVGMTSFVKAHTPDPTERAAGATSSVWVVAAAEPTSLAELTRHGWTGAPSADVPLTDDFADLLRFLHPPGW
jgi:hypothetical protein